MSKIKCPHCGASNQDVTEKEACWQCGSVLGAPVAQPEPPAPSASPTLNAPAVLLNREPAPQTPQAARPAASARRSPVLLLTIALLVVLVLIGLYELFKRH